uniref:Uncharacterized protein n=1 Tax=Chromera velia CCMP2878 TaxID=1169474 RepID=A0A0G4G472_9ALVE|eukprot:Cvel_20172.t1-p1 / transcript=Cvel_20172.t1 / gene=Cvel_20172 / organism=Chromera_velia_CCMP2878 / gene_product=hypothetical protein / transcript_product=hypothetical protein / location=Cvel_scaffold1793:6951-7178(+) / protein_length=76 / sequence_SO=supercontig / SO=protein_coding / is_pseudo=false
MLCDANRQGVGLVGELRGRYEWREEGEEEEEDEEEEAWREEEEDEMGEEAEDDERAAACLPVLCIGLSSLPVWFGV